MATMSQLRAYGGRIITIDGQRVVQLVDPNDNARRRFQYRRAPDGGLERRVQAHDHRPFRDSGSPWEPIPAQDVDAMRRVAGPYHPILDALGLRRG